ncbi:unnamed protein product [Effrenium voratum]|uniref:alpha-1,2-Mannosidase n=1 Tax=Effrenium voratum TaxID=2562239 RepID=A0AA36N4B3_9DINO|nr:unnamed protein product [Effrenium voratum]
MKASRVRRKGKRRKGAEDDDAEEPARPAIGLHWYIFSLSILMVTALSFLNFLALPDPRAHSLLSAVLLRRKASVSGDPHSDPALGRMSDEERVALLKAAEEALHAPLPVVAVTAAPPAGLLRGSRPSDFLPNMAAPPGGGFAPPALGRSAPSPVETLRARAKASSKPASESASRGGIAVFSGETWLQLDEIVDSDELTFGIWIYVPKLSEMVFPASSESMKTIASTKAAGCSTSSKGWALFVHEWSTTNRQLRLSWTDPGSGCNEIYSETSLIPYDKWTLVGFSLSKANNRASIMIDKNLVVDTQFGLGKYVRQNQPLQIQQANINQRVLSDSGKLLIGAHLVAKPEQVGTAHGFIGFMGDLRILRQSLEGSKLVHLLFCDTQDLITGSPQCGTNAQALAVLVQFQVGVEPLNALSGTLLQHGYVKTFKPNAGDGLPVPLRPWSAAPDHPLVQEPLAVEVDSLPGTTLDPEALKATWPKEWLQRFSEEELLKSQREADGWAAEVRAAMKHTWQGYRSKAWGHDEVQPGSGKVKDWCKMAITMLDGLSTLWVMGLKEEFEEAAVWLESSPLPAPGSHGQHSLFEINIRGFAGLLSAYSLSGKQIFLTTAQNLGEKLLGAFGTPSGMPLPTIDVGTGKAGMHSWNANTVLAEVTTLQVEFRYISQITGDQRWQEAADKALDVVMKAAGNRGLVPIYLSSPNKQAVSFVGAKMSMGAMGDSYYEYLLKQWIQGGKKDVRLKDTWKHAMQEMMDQMVVKTAGGLQFVAELEGGRRRNRMDHLACFVAGMLMLGSRNLPPNEVDPRWEPFAAELTYTCYQMYVRTPTGLSPEYVNFNVNSGKGQDMSIPGDAPQNLLRPEAAEAVWYMWYYTGDPKYRQWGHEMFLPFLKYSKAKFGFTAIGDVRKRNPPKRDSQESFWLGETLKYFYLIFAPRSTLNLEDDNVPPTQPRHLARLVQSADGLEDLQLVELPGVGHWFSQAEPSLASWLERRLAAELPEPPRSFEFTVTTPGHYGTKGSWRILQQLDASQPARIVVEANQSWRISSFNVRRLALEPGAPLGAAGAAVLQEVRLDGSVFDTKALLSGACTHLCRSHRHARWKICGKSSSDCAWRSLQRFASANDVLRAPVCLVAEPSWRRQAVALANKLYFVSRYAPPIVEAADAAGCESSNLVLLGGNVKSLSCSFPYIGFTEDSFVLDGNHYLANSTGLLAVGHLRERRLLLLAGEPTALAAVPVTSGRHGADFMLMGSEPWKGEANILAAGCLTPLWGISPSGWSEPDPHSGGFLGGVQTELAQPKCEEVELSDRELSGDAFRPSLGIFLLAIAFAMA